MNNSNTQDEKYAKIWSVGHSNRSLPEFLKILRNAKIETVVDCRSKPYSRLPHFNINRLEASLLADGITYEYRGDSLGGLGTNVNQHESILEIASRAEANERIALLCSEANPINCHRATVLLPLLETHHVQMEHIVYESR